MRRGRRAAVRVLRRARHRRPSAAASSSSRCATPTCRASTSSSARARANGVPGLRAARRRPSCASRARGDRRSRRCTRPQTGIVDFARGRRRLRARRRGARRRDPHRRRRARACRPAATASSSRSATARASTARARGRLRRRLVGPARRGVRRAAGRADRPVPRRLPESCAPERTHLVRGQIYPVPDPALPFLGVHLSRTIAGDVLLGPTALLAGARDAYRCARAPRRPRRHAALARHRRLMRAGGGPARASSPTRRAARLLVRDAAPLRARRSRRTTSSPGPAGVRAQARRPRRRAARRLRVRRAPARALHVVNAPSPRRHGFAGDRGPRGGLALSVPVTVREALVHLALFGRCQVRVGGDLGLDLASAGKISGFSASFGSVFARISLTPLTGEM